MPKKTNTFLITNKSNIQYLSDFTGSNGFLLLTKNQTYLFTDSRYTQRAKTSIKKGIKVMDMAKEKLKDTLTKHKISSIGVEESDLTVTRYKRFKKLLGKITLQDISGKIEEQREQKTKQEIDKTIKSQRINEKVFKEIRKIVKEYQKSKNPLKKAPTEIELAWKIKQLGNEYGANDVSFDPIVAFGQHSAIPHHAPDTTKLKKNDIVLIDMGMKYQDYCSDMTRTLLPPKPTEKQKNIHALVLKAQKHAIKHIKAGITGKKADDLSRDIIKDAGYGEFYTHSGGHGTGIEIHEMPSLSANYTKQIKENSIITVEPGIYLNGEFGVRIEDMILVTKKGNKNLTLQSHQ